MSSSDEIDLDAKVSGAAAVAGVDPAKAVAGAERVEAAGAIQTSAEIAAALASGQIDAITAQQLLVEAALAEQGGDLAPAQIEALRQQLVELLGDDPTLARLLNPV